MSILSLYSMHVCDAAIRMRCTSFVTFLFCKSISRKPKVNESYSSKGVNLLFFCTLFSHRTVYYTCRDPLYTHQFLSVPILSGEEDLQSRLVLLINFSFLCLCITFSDRDIRTVFQLPCLKTKINT